MIENDSYLKDNDEFNYLIIENINFFSNYSIDKSNYQNEMPYLLLPVLKQASDVRTKSGEMGLSLREAIDFIDLKNGNFLSTLYYHSKTQLNQIRRNPFLLFGFSENVKQKKQSLKNIINNIDALSNGESILAFAIKRKISNTDKIIKPNIRILPAINETPWFADFRNDEGFVSVFPVKTDFDSFYFKYQYEEGEYKTTYYHKYKLKTNHDYQLPDIVLHKSNGKLHREGVLDSYSTTKILYKNKESLIKALKNEKESLLNKTRDIDSRISEALAATS